VLVDEVWVRFAHPLVKKAHPPVKKAHPLKIDTPPE